MVNLHSPVVGDECQVHKCSPSCQIWSCNKTCILSGRMYDVQQELHPEMPNVRHAEGPRRFQLHKKFACPSARGGRLAVPRMRCHAYFRIVLVSLQSAANVGKRVHGNSVPGSRAWPAKAKPYSFGDECSPACRLGSTWGLAKTWVAERTTCGRSQAL